MFVNESPRLKTSLPDAFIFTHQKSFPDLLRKSSILITDETYDYSKLKHNSLKLIISITFSTSSISNKTNDHSNDWHTFCLKS